MVYREVSKDSPLVGEGTGLFVALFLILVITLGGISGVILFSHRSSDDTVETEPQPTQVEAEPADEEPEEPEAPISAIDFQPVVNNWVNTTGGNRSVLIYDLDRDELAGSYNADESYSTASLYKLFVVYEGYRRVQSGEWSADTIAGRTGHTILECLDLAIRESNSNCAETLWSMIGRDILNRLVRDEFGTTNTDVSSLVSTPSDILTMMKIFYAHKEIKDESLVATMKDSFLNQPVTEYDWRQGLPRGFSKANVYNKVGWDYNPEKKYWNIYHDVAIVEFPEENRHFAVVVMTNQVPFQKIRQLGTEIEQWFNKY